MAKRIEFIYACVLTPACRVPSSSLKTIDDRVRQWTDTCSENRKKKHLYVLLDES